MRPEFDKLAHGDQELEEWFQLAHCNTCGHFTLQPYYLGCSEHHTFCEKCVALNIMIHGNRCVECRHTFSEVDGTMFTPHASALLGLLHVKMPQEAQILERQLQPINLNDSFLRRLISVAENHIGQSTVHQHDVTAGRIGTLPRRHTIICLPQN